MNIVEAIAAIEQRFSRLAFPSNVTVEAEFDYLDKLIDRSRALNRLVLEAGVLSHQKTCATITEWPRGVEPPCSCGVRALIAALEKEVS